MTKRTIIAAAIYYYNIPYHQFSANQTNIVNILVGRQRGIRLAMKPSDIVDVSTIEQIALNGISHKSNQETA